MASVAARLLVPGNGVFASCCVCASAALLCIISGCCPVIVPQDPFGDDGTISVGVTLKDGVFYVNGDEPFATIGDGVMAKCRHVLGNIRLQGNVATLSDFDNLETVGGVDLTPFLGPLNT